MRAVARLLARFLGAEGRLAFRQLDRHRVRTALTAGVLVVAVIFAVGFGNSMLNNVRDVHDWLERVAVADFFLRGVWPDLTATVNLATLPERYADDLAAIDGVDRVGKFNWVQARAAGQSVLVLACTWTADGPLGLDLVSGDPAEVQRGLIAGEVVLGTPLGQRLGLGVGDRITVETRHGPQSLRVAGLATEYTVGGMTLYMEWSAAKRLFDLGGAHSFWITARDGAAASLEPRLRAFAAERGLTLQSYAELRSEFDRQIQGLLGSIWSLMSLLFVVASLGIVNTLTMNVLEQTRELGILRAVGMQRRQVSKMVVSQAVGLALVGLVPAIPGGVALAMLMNLCTYPLTGQHVDLHVSATVVAGCAAAAFAIATCSALVPAHRAARLEIIRAIQYE